MAITKDELRKIQRLAEAFGQIGVVEYVSFTIRVFGDIQYVVSELEQISMQHGAHLIDVDDVQTTIDVQSFQFTMLATDLYGKKWFKRHVTGEQLKRIVLQTFGGENDKWELDINSLEVGKINWRKQ